MRVFTGSRYILSANLRWWSRACTSRGNWIVNTGTTGEEKIRPEMTPQRDLQIWHSVRTTSTPVSMADLEDKAGCTPVPFPSPLFLSFPSLPPCYLFFSPPLLYPFLYSPPLLHFRRPLVQLGGLGSAVNFPSGVRCRTSAANAFLTNLTLEKVPGDNRISNSACKLA